MNPGVGKKRTHRGPAYGEPPTEKVATLANQHIQNLVEKQLTKETTLAEELQRKTNVCRPIIAPDESCSSQGIRTLEEFKCIREKEQKVELLRAAGLTEEEVELKLGSQENGNCTNQDQKRLKMIDEKIHQHEIELLEPSKYAGAVDVSRRELETDCALKLSDGIELRNFSYLVNKKEKEFSDKDPVWATLREYEENQRTCTNDDAEVEGDSDDDGCGCFVGPLLCNINKRVKLIPNETIIKNRISLTEILDMDRFKNYKAGEPNRILYVKNLARGVTEGDLASLFARYCKDEDGGDVEYRMMDGRMRGQAFVTFPDVQTAVEALLFVNGYNLHSKPVIISYAKKKEGVK